MAAVEILHETIPRPTSAEKKTSRVGVYLILALDQRRAIANARVHHHKWIMSGSESKAAKDCWESLMCP